MPIPTAKLKQMIADAERALARMIAARHALLVLPQDSAVARQAQSAKESIDFTRVQMAQWKAQLESALTEGKESSPQ
jgi:hypothetical protein